MSCKEDFSKSCYEKPSAKQPSFQIHVDEPDGACTKKPQQAIEAFKAKSITKDSPLTINNAVAQLRQPLATIDQSAMDVSFGGLRVCQNVVSLHQILSIAFTKDCRTTSAFTVCTKYKTFFGQTLPWICLCWRGRRNLPM